MSQWSCILISRKYLKLSVTHSNNAHLLLYSFRREIKNGLFLRSNLSHIQISVQYRAWGGSVAFTHCWSVSHRAEWTWHCFDTCKTCCHSYCQSITSIFVTFSLNCIMDGLNVSGFPSPIQTSGILLLKNKIPLFLNHSSSAGTHYFHWWALKDFSSVFGSDGAV